MRHPNRSRFLNTLFVVGFAPLVAGCSGDMLSFRDQEWFSRPQRVFLRNISIDAPPLTPDKVVGPDDLISADGLCPGMAPPLNPGDANALADGSAPPSSQPALGGSVALGHTECDVARGAGAPDSVNLSSDAAGRRVAVLTYARGPRAGIYTFTSGRLASVERGPEPVAQPRVAKPKAKKPRTTG